MHALLCAHARLPLIHYGLRSNFVSLSVMKRAKTVAFISEYSRTFTAAMRDGARSTAEDLGLKVVADIGIKRLDSCPDGTTCSKPTPDTLTKLIPAGGGIPPPLTRVG